MNLKFWKKPQAPVISLNTDYHSHILPGVDDGIATMKGTLDILAEYEQLGIMNVWFTPHIMEDCPNTTEGLKARFAEVLEAYKGPVKLNLAAEYMMDNLFHKRLAEGDLLPIGNCLLVETSYFNPPRELDQILKAVKFKGYVPILAHPERYIYMEKSDYEKLKAEDIRFQMNIGSIKGFYGTPARAKAQWMYNKGYYDYYGSDLHHRSMVSLLKDEK